jgi:hypothetical protein
MEGTTRGVRAVAGYGRGAASEPRGRGARLTHAPYRLYLTLLAGLWLATLGQTLPQAEGLAVAVEYAPDHFAEQLRQLKGLGVRQVVVRLRELPSPSQWQAMLEACAQSELEWWLWLAHWPRAAGWVVLPERYRLRGNEQGVYTLQIAGARETLLALAPRDQPSLQGLSRLTLSGGRAVAAIGESAESLLLLYPRLENALPDLWDGWDRERDALIALLQTRQPDGRFRGWLVESSWDAQSAASLPDSPRFAAEWQGFLQQRYGELTELERAWDTATPLSRFEQATRLIPLWHGERGLPLLVSLDALQKPMEVVPRLCRFWDDYHAFLGERWRVLLRGLRQALLAFTPEAGFALVQPMPDPTDLPVPDALRDALLPTAVYLPARWRSAWRPFLIRKSASTDSKMQTVILEWTGESVERVSLIQELAREMGAAQVVWHVRDIGTLPRDTWQALQAVDAGSARAQKPHFFYFPTSLWSATRIQKWRAGWWVPQEGASELQPLFWGFELFAFWRPVEIQVAAPAAPSKRGERELIRVHWSGKNGTPRLESPLTPSLSPLLKGGEGEGSGGILSKGTGSAGIPPAKISRCMQQLNSSDVPLSGEREEVRGDSVVRCIELYLWREQGEREIILRRFDQKPLDALHLDGEPVPLTVRGNTVRLKVGTVPVRVRGFEMLPLCESVVNDWTQRVDSLLKRNTAASQDTRVLRFLFESALTTYRRDPVQGFALLRNAWLEAERAFQPYRLVEAESSPDHTFGTVRRDLAASGGATLWLHTPLPPGADGFYARYPLNIRTDGVYHLYLACRLRSDSTEKPDGIEWQIFSGTEEKAPLARGSAPLDAARAVSHYADGFIWLPLGSTALKAGDHVLVLRYLPATDQPPFYAEWDMVLVAPPGVVPRGAMPPAY